MDATVSDFDGAAGRVAQRLVSQPDLLSRDDIESLCRNAVVEARRGGSPRSDRGWSGDDSDSFAQSLQSLGHLAIIGQAVPDFGHWPWYSRRVARLAARCVLYLSKFLATQQTRFNAACLNLLRDLSLQMTRFESNQRVSSRRVEVELQERIDALEARIAALQDEMRRQQLTGVDP